MNVIGTKKHIINEIKNAKPIKTDQKRLANSISVQFFKISPVAITNLAIYAKT